MKPLIGITGNFGDKGCELAKGYYQSVLEAGGSPVVIPPYTDASAMSALLDELDGIILSGGSDMNPLLVGEEPIPQLHGINPERDVPELMLIRQAYDMQINVHRQNPIADKLKFAAHNVYIHDLSALRLFLEQALQAYVE